MKRILKINGEEVYISPQWSVNDAINTRTTFSFTIIDLLNLTDVDIGDEVIFTKKTEGEDDDILFAGDITNVDDYEVNPNLIEYNITAVDYSARTDKRLVADSTRNKLAGDIIKENILPILAEEDVEEGDIQDGPLLSKAVFNYNKASEALDYISDVTGYNWNIGFDKKLNFFSNDTNTAPFGITDTTQHYGFKRSKSRDQYRNMQYIRAGNGRTSLQEKRIPTPKPDGESRTFIVGFPLAQRPEIFINEIQVPEDRIGINGLDENKDWYFSFNSNAVTQDSEAEPLSETDVIKISFVGLFPILILEDNQSEISNRESIEIGTSGKYETLDEVANINEIDQSIEFAQGLLNKYGIIPSTVEFNTEIVGLRAGQLININKSLYGINDNFLIETITLSAIGNQINYAVKCLDGTALGGWEEFFRELTKKGKSISIQENEIVTRLLKISEGITLSDSVAVQSAAPETRVDHAIVGYSEVG